MSMPLTTELDLRRRFTAFSLVVPPRCNTTLQKDCASNSTCKCTGWVRAQRPKKGSSKGAAAKGTTRLSTPQPSAMSPLRTMAWQPLQYGKHSTMVRHVAVIYSARQQLRHTLRQEPCDHTKHDSCTLKKSGFLWIWRRLLLLHKAAVQLVQGSASVGRKLTNARTTVSTEDPECRSTDCPKSHVLHHVAPQLLRAIDGSSMQVAQLANAIS